MHRLSESPFYLHVPSTLLSQAAVITDKSHLDTTSKHERSMALDTKYSTSSYKGFALFTDRTLNFKLILGML